MEEKGKQESRKMEWEAPVLTALSKGAWSVGACESGSDDNDFCGKGLLVGDSSCVKGSIYEDPSCGKGSIYGVSK